MLDASRFSAVVRRLGGEPAPALADELLAAYAEPGRFYHSSAHIADCLRQLDRHRAIAQRGDEVELAIWFHDAVYDTRRSDNEEASAVWAERGLAAAGLSAASIGRIAQMVRATRHHEATDDDTRLLLDIDLSILGADRATFRAYDAAIRQEYAWVPEPDYRAGHAKVLRAFLAREPIYRSMHLRVLYETAAKDNLRQALAELAV